MKRLLIFVWLLLASLLSWGAVSGSNLTSGGSGACSASQVTASITPGTNDLTCGNTSTPHAPWFVIPADNKWFTRLAVAAAIVDTLDDLNLSYPKVDSQKRKELQAARKVLLGNQHSRLG